MIQSGKVASIFTASINWRLYKGNLSRMKIKTEVVMDIFFLIINSQIYHSSFGVGGKEATRGGFLGCKQYKADMVRQKLRIFPKE